MNSNTHTHHKSGILIPSRFTPGGIRNSSDGDIAGILSSMEEMSGKFKIVVVTE